MLQKLYWEVTPEILRKVLNKLMLFKELCSFRLVGGTSLNLQLGHRISDDIDMFTDMEYGQADFKCINALLEKNFTYVGKGTVDDFNLGLMRLVGDSPEDCVKVDFFYTDLFIRPEVEIEGVRLAHIEDILASKLKIIAGGGRKKDFWDLSELFEHYQIDTALDIFKEKFPWSDPADVLKGLTNFTRADDMEDPKCVKGKVWELIKLDMEEMVDEYIRLQSKQPPTDNR
jgi:hypothetical protein